MKIRFLIVMADRNIQTAARTTTNNGWVGPQFFSFFLTAVDRGQPLTFLKNYNLFPKLIFIQFWSFFILNFYFDIETFKIFQIDPLNFIIVWNWSFSSFKNMQFNSQTFQKLTFTLETWNFLQYVLLIFLNTRNPINLDLLQTNFKLAQNHSFHSNCVQVGIFP